MPYNPNIPQPTDILSDSQGDLLGNFQALDTSFGIDHYKFSDLTANNGFHNKVTTPVFVANPPTGLPPVTVANPVFYGFQQTAPLGVLQYSRGPNNAVPTPVTMIQSSSTPIVLASGASTNVLDFTGITNAMFNLWAVNNGAPQGARLYFFGGWDGATFTAIGLGPIDSVNLTATNAGNTLRVTNTAGAPLNNVYWTLQFLRIS